MQFEEQPGKQPFRLALFASLRYRNYRFYWVGLSIYVIGVMMEYVAAAWLVWEISGNPLLLGALGFCSSVPLVLIQLYSGVVADRTDRLRLLIIAQLLIGLVLLCQALLVFTGLTRVEFVLALVVLSASLRAFEQPSRYALVIHLIDREELQNAVALGSVPWQAGRVIAPSIAGILLALFGAGSVFLLSGLCLLAAMSLYLNIRMPKFVPRQAQESALQRFAEGISFIKGHALFVSLIGLTFFNSIFGMSYVTLLPIFADRILEVGSPGYGFLQGAGGLGAILGTLTIANLFTFRRRGLLMLGGAIAFGTLLMVFSQSRFFPLSIFLISTVSFSNTIYMTLVNTTLQAQVPDELRGRVMGMFGMAYNLVPLGGLVAGSLAAAFDAPTAVTIGGLTVASVAGYVMLTQARVRRVEIEVVA